MDDVEEAHDGGAVVGDGGALVVVDELVHPSGAQRGPHRVRHRRARADVAQHLPAALRRVRALLEQDDLRLLRKSENPTGKRVRIIARSVPSLLACVLARERRRRGGGGSGLEGAALTIIPDMAGGCAAAELGFGVRGERDLGGGMRRRGEGEEGKGFCGLGRGDPAEAHKATTQHSSVFLGLALGRPAVCRVHESSSRDSLLPNVSR